MKTRYVMIIDLHKCVGCAACEIACKTHNEVPTGVFLTHHANMTTGVFPNTKYVYKPLMCNHCDNAPCVKACATGAMHKDEYGLTVCDADKCIQCGLCAKACPYGMITPAPKKTVASNIAAMDSVMGDVTGSGPELQEAVGAKYPCHDPILDEYDLPMVKAGSPLKCQMCKQLVYNGDKPYCVDACAAGARIFGDVENVYESTLYDLMQSYKMTTVTPTDGAKPAVYYMREFNKTW